MLCVTVYFSSNFDALITDSGYLSDRLLYTNELLFKFSASRDYRVCVTFHGHHSSLLSCTR